MDSTIVSALIAAATAILCSFIAYLASKGAVKNSFLEQDIKHSAQIERLIEKLEELKENGKEKASDVKEDIRELRTELRDDNKEITANLDKLTIRLEDLAARHRSLVNGLANQGIYRGRVRGDKETSS